MVDTQAGRHNAAVHRWSVHMVKSYSDEFKREAIALVEGGTPARQVADDLGIRYWTLVGWLRKKREAGAEPKSPLTVEEENRQLREENRRLKLEREILKKATAFFASEKP